jgi:hypothetical protein
MFLFARSSHGFSTPNIKAPSMLRACDCVAIQHTLMKNRKLLMWTKVFNSKDFISYSKKHYLTCSYRHTFRARRSYFIHSGNSFKNLLFLYFHEYNFQCNATPETKKSVLPLRRTDSFDQYSVLLPEARCCRAQLGKSLLGMNLLCFCK